MRSIATAVFLVASAAGAALGQPKPIQLHVDDPKSGITVSSEDGGQTLEARRGNELLWSSRGFKSPPVQRLEAQGEQLVAITAEGSAFFDIRTGKMLKGLVKGVEAKRDHPAVAGDFRPGPRALGKGRSPGPVVPVQAGSSYLSVPVRLPVAALRDELLKGILREKGAQTLPVTLKEESGKRVTVSTHIETVITVTEPVKVVTSITRKVPKREKLLIGVIFPVAVFNTILVEETIDKIEWIEKQIQKAVRSVTDVEMEFGYALRLNHVDLRMSGNQVDLVVEIGLSLSSKIVKAGPVPIGAKDIDKSRVTVALSRAVEWSEDGRRLILKPAGKTEVHLDPSIKLTAFTMGLNQLLTNVLPVIPFLEDKLAAELDRELTKRFGEVAIPDFDKLVEPLTKPHPLGGDAWLALRPEAILISPLRADGDVLSTGLTVQARPVVSVGKQPEAVKSPPVRPVPGMPPADSWLQGEVVLASEWLSGQLTKLAAGQVRNWLPGAEVGAVRVRPGKGKGVRVEVPVAVKEVTGTIVLTGTPEYDPKERVLRLADLDGSVQMNGLLGLAVQRLLGPRLQDALKAHRDKLRLELGGTVDGLGQVEHTAGPVCISARVTKLEPGGLVVTPEGEVRLPFVLEGAAQVRGAKTSGGR
jgi:Domain of unknown function (DUF4403)